MPSMPLPFGQVVSYMLTTEDMAIINSRRFSIASESRGTPPSAGDIFPAIVVRLAGDNTVNLQVFLDGNDSHWVLGAVEGETAGCWSFRNH